MFSGLRSILDLSQHGANTLFGLANGALVLGATLVLAGTILAIWTGGVRERYADERISNNESRTASANAQAESAKADAAKAQASLALAEQHSAEANAKAEAFRLDIARANERAGLAQQRAAEAQLALQRFKAPRLLTAQQLEVIENRMRSRAGTSYTFGVFNDSEPIALMNQIEGALNRAGWKEVAWHGGGDIVLNRGNQPVAGYVVVSGIYVQADIMRLGDLGNAAYELAAAISTAGIPAKPEIGNMPPNSNNSAVVILVGKKAQD